MIHFSQLNKLYDHDHMFLFTMYRDARGSGVIRNESSGRCASLLERTAKYYTFNLILIKE